MSLLALWSRDIPESLSDNASAFSSRSKQLHRRMWWRDMKVGYEEDRGRIRPLLYCHLTPGNWSLSFHISPTRYTQALGIFCSCYDRIINYTVLSTFISLLYILGIIRHDTVFIIIVYLENHTLSLVCRLLSLNLELWNQIEIKTEENSFSFSLAKNILTVQLKRQSLKKTNQRVHFKIDYEI